MSSAVKINGSTYTRSGFVQKKSDCLGVGVRKVVVFDHDAIGSGHHGQHSDAEVPAEGALA